MSYRLHKKANDGTSALDLEVPIVDTNTAGAATASPDLPGDVIVIIKSMYLVGPNLGLPIFEQRKHGLFPKPAGLENIRDDTWEQLSSDYARIGAQMFQNSTVCLLIPGLVIVYAVLYAIFLVDQIQGGTTTPAMMMLGFFLSILSGFLYMAAVHRSLKAYVLQIEDVTSQFQAAVRQDGFLLEYVKDKHSPLLRTHMVRFRPLEETSQVNDGVSALPAVPVRDQMHKMAKGETLILIILAYASSQLLSYVLFKDK